MANEKSTAPEEIKPPNPAVVAKAEAKVEAGDDLNQREQAALDAQAEIDRARGYKTVDWKGVTMYQSADGHALQNEEEMIRHVNEMRVAAADPFNQSR